MAGADLRAILDWLAARGLSMPADSRCRRTYAGRHQRDAGAWSWYVGSSAPCISVGSQWPMRAVARSARADTLTLVVDGHGDHWLFPDDV